MRSILLKNDNLMMIFCKLAVLTSLLSMTILAVFPESMIFSVTGLNQFNCYQDSEIR